MFSLYIFPVTLVTLCDIILFLQVAVTCVIEKQHVNNFENFHNFPLIFRRSLWYLFGPCPFTRRIDLYSLAFVFLYGVSRPFL